MKNEERKWKIYWKFPGMPRYYSLIVIKYDIKVNKMLSRKDRSDQRKNKQVSKHNSFILMPPRKGKFYTKLLTLQSYVRSRDIGYVLLELEFGG